MAEAAAILTGASAINQAIGQRQQANAIRTQSDFEAKLAEMLAVDVTARGELAAQRVGMQTRGLIGSQRAALAASGVDVNSGSAADLQVDAAKFSAMDEQIIRNNAAREAMGIRTNSKLAQLAARNEAQAFRDAATQTLITGAAQTYDVARKSKGGGQVKTDVVARAAASPRAVEKMVPTPPLKNTTTIRGYRPTPKYKGF